MKTMRSFIAAAILVSTAAFSTTAKAEEPKHYLGFQLDVGAPDGVNLGISAHPYVQWMRVVVSGSYNYLSPGVRAELTLDPMPWAAGLTLTGDVGHFWPGSVPEMAGSPSVAYSYVNLQPGLEFGRRNSWRLFFRGGVSWVDAKITNIVINNDKTFVFSNTDANFRLAPSAKIGFVKLF
jgi:hypothetical protein